MKISGIAKLTLLDYPGKTAATVFTPGCNLRCPFCQNAGLVSALRFPEVPLEEFFSFLESRKGLLDGVCVSGGEPLLQDGIEEFCGEVRSRGFAVKLDTNGTLPRRLDRMLEAGLVDRVAMDVKNCPDRYGLTTGVDGLSAAPVEESMRALFGSKVPFELRTTIARPLHDEKSLVSCARWIAETARKSGFPAEEVPWFLQKFVDGEELVGGTMELSAFEDDEARGVLSRIQGILPAARLRGM